MSKTIRFLTVGGVVALCALTFSDTALGQCAMCRAGVSQVFAKHLNLAIVVLFVPPIAIFSTIFFIAFRKRKG